MTHTDSVGLLWTRDGPVAEASDNTQHSQGTDIHGPRGIGTRSSSKLEAVDPLLTPRGPRNQIHYN